MAGTTHFAYVMTKQCLNAQSSSPSRERASFQPARDERVESVVVFSNGGNSRKSSFTHQPFQRRKRLLLWLPLDIEKVQSDGEDQRKSCDPVQLRRERRKRLFSHGFR